MTSVECKVLLRGHAEGCCRNHHLRLAGRVRMATARTADGPKGIGLPRTTDKHSDAHRKRKKNRSPDARSREERDECAARSLNPSVPPTEASIVKRILSLSWLSPDRANHRAPARRSPRLLASLAPSAIIQSCSRPAATHTTTHTTTQKEFLRSGFWILGLADGGGNWPGCWPGCCSLAGYHRCFGWC